MRVNQSRRVFTLASPANLSVPILGRIVPYGGGLLVPSKLHQLRPFAQAIRRVIKQRHVVMIYPEPMSGLTIPAFGRLKMVLFIIR